MEYKFYKEYIKLLDDDYNFRKEKTLTEFEKKLRHSKFRKFVLDKIGYTYNAILKIQYIMRSGMLRPQRLIIDSTDFYVACDMLTNTYYICYKYLMMIDVDFYKLPVNHGDIDNTKKQEGLTNPSQEVSIDTS